MLSNHHTALTINCIYLRDIFCATIIHIPYRGKLRRGKFLLAKIIRHLENILSLFSDENFPQLHLRVAIFDFFNKYHKTSYIKYNNVINIINQSIITTVT